MRCAWRSTWKSERRALLGSVADELGMTKTSLVNKPRLNKLAIRWLRHYFHLEVVPQILAEEETAFARLHDKDRNVLGVDFQLMDVSQTTSSDFDDTVWTENVEEEADLAEAVYKLDRAQCMLLLVNRRYFDVLLNGSKWILNMVHNKFATVIDATRIVYEFSFVYVVVSLIRLVDFEGAFELIMMPLDSFDAPTEVFFLDLFNPLAQRWTKPEEFILTGQINLSVMSFEVLANIMDVFLDEIKTVMTCFLAVFSDVSFRIETSRVDFYVLKQTDLQSMRRCIVSRFRHLDARAIQLDYKDTGENAVQTFDMVMVVLLNGFRIPVDFRGFGVCEHKLSLPLDEEFVLLEPPDD